MTDLKWISCPTQRLPKTSQPTTARSRSLEPPNLLWPHTPHGGVYCSSSFPWAASSTQIFHSRSCSWIFPLIIWNTKGRAKKEALYLVIRSGAEGCAGEKWLFKKIQDCNQDENCIWCDQFQKTWLWHKDQIRRISRLGTGWASSTSTFWKLSLFVPVIVSNNLDLIL